MSSIPKPGAARCTHQILSRTLDAGQNIELLGTTGLSGDSPFVTILTLDPNPGVAQPDKNRVIFLGGSKGLIPHLFRSANAGQSWNRVESVAGDGTATPFVPEGEITAIEFAPSNSNVVYVNPLDTSRVFKGVFDGPAWTWVDASGSPDFPWLPLPDVPTSAVAAGNSTGNDVAFVGTDVGVYMTWNGGRMWVRLALGLPRVPVTRLRLHLAARWLYAATMGRGVYRLRILSLL